MTCRDVASYCFLSERTIYRLIQAGDFPQPIRLSVNRVAWRRPEVDEWINSRPRGATNQQG